MAFHVLLTSCPLSVCLILLIFPNATWEQPPPQAAMKESFAAWQGHEQFNQNGYVTRHCIIPTDIRETFPSRDR